MPKDEQTGEANPYALLNKNFDSKYYDRDICMWIEKPDKDAHLKVSGASDASHNDADSSCHLSNFTYDKLQQPIRPLNNIMKAPTNQPSQII